MLTLLRAVLGEIKLRFMSDLLNDNLLNDKL